MSEHVSADCDAANPCDPKCYAYGIGCQCNPAPKFRAFMEDALKNPGVRAAYERSRRSRDVKVYFDFADWWIGWYRGPNHHYVCPLPTLVISWRRRVTSSAEGDA